MTFKYLPALKAKMGELTALNYLDPKIKTEICPLLEIPSVSWDYSEDKPSKPIKSHLKDVISAIEKNWNKDFFLDFSDNLQIEAIENGIDLLSSFKEEAKDKNINYIPTIDFDKNMDENYINSLKEIQEEKQKGLCLRIKYSDLEDVVEPSKFEELLSLTKIPTSEIDLILDFGSINSYDSDKTLYLATRLVLSSIPMISEWRTISVLASSFPFTLSGIPKNTIRPMNRVEWLSWVRLYEKKDKLERLPIYGDYSISHPEVVEIDPRVMSMSASIRYSSIEEWIIVKGESIKIGGFKQFPTLSKKLTLLPDYSGKDFSWGDGRIYDYANATDDKSGNATTWRSIGNNHHFTLVTNQISNLP